jgi:hypothetical protein
VNVAAPSIDTNSSNIRSASTALALLAGAIAPVLIAVALLASVALHRPFLARYLESDTREDCPETGLARRLTLIWGIGLLLIGGMQAAFSTTANLSLLGPLDILIRTFGALALEGVLLTVTALYIRRRR